MIVNIRKSPDFDVYIGRYNNPNEYNELACYYIEGDEYDGAREETVRKFAYDLHRQWLYKPYFRNAVLNARFKVLGCFCDVGKELCHGMVIHIFIDQYDKYGAQKALDYIHNITMESEDYTLDILTAYRELERNKNSKIELNTSIGDVYF